MRENVDPAQTTARIAGALYLLSAVTAGVPLIYVSSTLIVPGNAATTANNIPASEAFFRASIVSELIGAIVFIFMVGALYRLLKGVNQTHASLDGDLGAGLGPHLIPQCVERNRCSDIAARCQFPVSIRQTPA
jgi:hypothetical protein